MPSSPISPSANMNMNMNTNTLNMNTDIESRFPLRSSSSPSGDNNSCSCCAADDDGKKPRSLPISQINWETYCNSGTRASFAWLLLLFAVLGLVVQQSVSAVNVNANANANTNVNVAASSSTLDDAVNSRSMMEVTATSTATSTLSNTNTNMILSDTGNVTTRSAIDVETETRRLVKIDDNASSTSIGSNKPSYTFLTVTCHDMSKTDLPFSARFWHFCDEVNHSQCNSSIQSAAKCELRNTNGDVLIFFTDGRKLGMHVCLVDA
eukprot:jgi/Psemu1/27402/gm1.27402_g